MDTQLYNQGRVINSLQVSVLKDVTPGDFNPGVVFLIKNNTEDDLEVTIVPAGQSEPVTTTLYTGWNPELIKQIINAPSGLQYGY